FDTVGGDVRVGCYAVLRPGGRLVWIAPAPEGFRPPRNDVETLRPNVKRDRVHLERMLALLDAGAVRPPTIVRYKLSDAGEAHRLSESRHLQGKLVFVVRCLLPCPAAAAQLVFFAWPLRKCSCSQESRVMLANSCSRNNARGDDFARHSRLARFVELFAG